MSDYSDPLDEDATKKMNEYRELAKNVHQLRDNVLEMDDQIQVFQWVAAGGLGTSDMEKMERLAEANREIAENIEDLVEEAPNPRKVRDGEHLEK